MPNKEINLINNDICGIVCHPYQVHLVGVGDSIPCEILLMISEKHSSFPPHVMLFVLLNKRKSKALC